MWTKSTTMASTPSASALSAVLWCRGNIWTRNPPNKRPATSGYSLGLGSGTQRDSLTERTRSNQTSARGTFLQGHRVVVGRRLTVAYKSPRVDGNMLREKDFREINKLVYSKLSQSTRHAHSAAQNALVRQLARRMILKLPGVNKCSKIIHIIKCETYPDICKLAFLQETSGSPAGVLKVSIMSPRLMKHAGQLLNTLKSTCLTLTALVSEVMLLWRPNSSREGASRHSLCHQDEKIIKHNVLQVRLHLKKKKKKDLQECMLQY